MISFAAQRRVFVSTLPVDFRKGMHGLVALVAENLKNDPYCGDVFIFRAKRNDRLKLLVFDGSGMVLATKWLEQGGFAWRPVEDGATMLTPTQFTMLFDGVSKWMRIAPKAVESHGKPRESHGFSSASLRAMAHFRIMTLRSNTPPSDPALLMEWALALEAENESLRATIVTLNALIFGARSERLSTIGAEQLALDLIEGHGDTPGGDADNDNGAGESPVRKQRKKAARNIGRLPEHLPRCERVIEPATTLCPCCSGKMHRIGEDVSEMLDRVPAVLRVLRTIRPKYACRACESAVVQAPAPARLIEGGIASTALVAHIAVAKYGWLSTLYRQAQVLAGQGVALDRQTLARWMKQAAWMLEGLYDLQLATMHCCPRLFCDETPMPVLAPKRVKIRQFWAHATDDRPWAGPAPPAVDYVFAGSRGKKEIAAQLCGFSGILQVDGYAAYKALVKDAKTRSGVMLAFCLAHARRKFGDVFKTTNSPFAREVIEKIAAVYAIKKRIRGKSAELRKAVRLAETKPIMDALHARLLAVRDGLSQISPLTKSIRYMLDHWSGLTRFLDDSRIEPDTNIVERPIRAIAIGKRNSLFAGDEGGAKTWAILSTLIQTAKLNEIDPETWLADVLERVVSGATTNDRHAELLAWNWIAAREQEKLAA